MKIGMILISNRPNDLESLLKTIPKLGKFREFIEIYAIIQPPFTGNEEFLRHLHGYKLVDSVAPPTPFISFRKAAMEMANHCDWFWSLDDDHRIQDSQGIFFNKTAEEYYLDVFSFLLSTKAGALQCKGFLGGYGPEYDFIINPDNGLVATDKGGIFLRNIGVDKIIEPDETNLRGALFESLAIYNIMSHGYNFYRRFNSPISNRPPGAGKHIGGSKNASYSDATVNANVQGRIREKFNDPNWTHSSKKYPKDIAKRICK